MLTTDVAPVTIVGSPMLNGSRAGRAPKTPASYTSSRSGATVRCARLTAMFGSPTPTKQTRCPASSRAAATIIISFWENAAPFFFPVVGALDIRGMCPEGLDHDGIHDEAGDDRSVGIGPDDVLGHQLLHDHDDPVGRERRLLLAAEQ